MTRSNAVVGLNSPTLMNRRGRGVRVAVVDSGVASGHPHVGIVSAGVTVERDGTVSPNSRDELGHGTAVAAVIREKAPEAELLPVRVFQHSLDATAPQLAFALTWAIEHGVQLINLSLGTANRDHEVLLTSIIRTARERGVLVVTAYESAGSRWLPGSIPGTVPVVLDDGCPRHELRLVDGEAPVRLAASGLPRPIPGVPPERNLRGISFAVANVTGILAVLLEGQNKKADLPQLLEWIHAAAVPG